MSANKGRRIVVGVDFDICGDDAVIEALRLINSGWASELHAVHVLDPVQVVDDPALPAMLTEERILEDAPDAVRRRMREVAQDAGLAFPEQVLAVHARLGKPADALQQVAVDYDADLIVVGIHKRCGLDRVLLGSVAQELVRSASCPVLVARPKDHSRYTKTPRPDAPYAAGEAPAPQASPVDRPVHISTERTSEPSTFGRIF
jgi:nucleotide-binding universal stress UspA family protein